MSKPALYTIIALLLAFAGGVLYMNGELTKLNDSLLDSVGKCLSTPVSGSGWEA